MKHTNTTQINLAILAANAESNIGTVALSLELTDQADGWCQLLPAGHFQAVDGRPHDVPGGNWFVDGEIAARVISLANAAANDLVIDYEHQTLNADQNGHPAPAAGWFKEMEWREGSGLWIKPKWTPRASEYIQGEEYRFLSAVFPFDKRTGYPLSLHSAALVNRPGIDGMQAVEALRAQLTTSQSTTQETPAMNAAMRKLLAKLGIELKEDEDLTDDQATAALSALVDLQSKAAKGEEAETALAALKAQGGKPDPAQYVPMKAFEALQQQVAALSADAGANEIDQLIKDATEDGRLLPAMEDWARDLGNKDVAALKGYLDKAKPLAALKGMQSDDETTQKGKDDQSVAALSDADKEAARLLGKTHEEYAALKAAQA